MPYGRPLKSKTRRTHITISAPEATIAAIDAFVAEYVQATGIPYSRSDFYNEAALAKLRENGIDVDDKPERTISVLKKNGTKNDIENVVDSAHSKAQGNTK